MSVIVKQLLESSCEVRGTEVIAACDNRIVLATDADWDANLAPIIAVKTVSGLHEAISHIRLNGSGHTESIITEDKGEADILNEIDSAIVMNASTQFADGGEFGMGAEIGIATGRLHARGLSAQPN